ncbi:hypothetical protein WME90_27020 [Sorangium sp. So ce375]|uniref:hypothetical protein n=1 Tax=Sorangium sp. So ce375 TaxID=3133306 RepID=UPI003F5B45AE
MSVHGQPAGRARRAQAARSAARRAGPGASLISLLVASTAAAPPEQEQAEAADEPAKPPVEELFLGEAAFPQEALELQITSAPTWEHDGRRVGFSVPLLLELGITDRLQLGGELPLELARGDSGVVAGLGAVEVEALYNVVNDRWLGLVVSAGLGAELPAGSRELGAPGYALEPFVSLDKAIGGVHVGISASAEIRLPAARRDETELSPGAALGVILPLGDVVPTVELAAELEDTLSLLLAPGVLWHPASGLELGAALEIGLAGETPDAGLMLLVTTEIELAGDGDDHVKHASRSRAP